MRYPDETEVLGEGRWRMWALVVSSPPYAQPYYEPDHRLYANAYRLKDEPSPVPVLVTEAEDGPYYGWIDKDKDTPVMIHGSEGLFRMCFAYGPQAEVDRGKGRIVRLNIERLEENGN